MAKVICPSCKKAGGVPEQYLGNHIKCLNCGERFKARVLPEPGPTVELVQREVVTLPDLIHDLEPLPPQRLKDCYFCGEKILEQARKCKYCGEIVDPALRTAEEAKAAARQQASNVSVNTVVETTLGGYQQQTVSRMVPIGLLLFFIGWGLIGGESTRWLGVTLFGIGVMLVAIGLLVSLWRGLMSLFS